MATKQIEKWELVTSFPSLKTGDYVKVHCDHEGCGDVHRGLLGSPRSIQAVGPDGTKSTGPRYGILGGSPCNSIHVSADIRKSGRSISVAASTVDRRIVFRLDTGLEQEDLVETLKKKPAKV